MVSHGVERFRHNLSRNREQGRGSQIGGSKTALSTVIEPLAAAIRQFQDDAAAGKAGPKHSLIRLVENVDPEVLAFLTARAVLNHQYGKRRIKLTATAGLIGRSVQLEERVNQFEIENPALCRVVVNDLNTRTGHEGHRVKVMRHVLDTNSEKGWAPWSGKEYVHVGIKLLELLEEATSIITLEHVNVGKKGLWVIELSASFWTWIEQLNDTNEVKFPNFMPCVIPPKPWTSVKGGGYHTDTFVFPIPLVRRMTEAHKKLLEEADLGEVYDTLNAVQETAWRVEKRTLEVAEEIIRTEIDIGVLPPMEKELLPTKPTDIASNSETRTEWKRRAREVHERNERVGSKRLTALRQTALAREMAEYPAIYFPHSLDFRGRLYPVPTVLNPQETDLGRAMLVFAEGAPIEDDRAEGWLAIHGANMWGEDKSSLGDRVQWVYENSEKICRVAADPLGNLWWTEADEPWCFLSWVFEWADFQREGRGFVSRIPIALDGTCNGLQHYSAMLRDPIGGAAVNLLPSDEPQDIYEEVAKVVREKLQGLSATGDDKAWMAALWLNFGIDRKLTKRPVMVLPYGGTQRSCRNYILEAAREEIEAGKENPFGDDLLPATVWLAAIVWDSIGEVVVAARHAMGWLKTTARAADDRNSPLVWTAPNGFPVLQAYGKLARTRVDTRLHGSVVKLVLADDTNELDRRRQVNGVAPNFVHSMDAAALCRTVGYGIGNGVTSYAMIHDSYGTLAAHTDMLAACTRHAFVDMYEDHDVLSEFRDSIAKLVPGKELPTVPAFGDLDLSEVLESQFFFA
jgi:DNA-directed RNA polymerase